MFTFNSKVRYSECDAEGLLTIPALINYLQDCSTFHTESIGFGLEHCASLGFAWFIAAWQIRIGRLPRFTEEIRVSTWPFAKNPNLANRHFLVETTAGEHLVLADSLWFPFDLDKGRPVRIPESEKSYLSDESPLTLPPTRRKIKLAGEGMPKTPIVVAEHHLDSNHHVNNGQYVSMADSVIRAYDEEFCAGSLQVQYKLAARLGDVIVPSLYVEDDGYAVDLAQENGASYAAVRMTRQ